MKVNLPREQAALWWKFTITQPLQGPARFEVWAIFFDVANPSLNCAAKETFLAADASVATDRLRCAYGENVLEHGHSHGAIGAETRIEWSIDWGTPEAGFRHFPQERMYDGPFPRAKALSPVLTTAFDGTVRVGKRTLRLAGHRGMQGHNWGEKHADSWVWAHCNLFSDHPGMVFEAVSSRISVGPLSSPRMTILHADDGTNDPITVNGWMGMMRTTSDLDGLHWRFRGQSGNRGLEGVFHAAPERFVGVNYYDPDGRITHCLNSKVAEGELRILHRDRGIWRLHRAMRADASAALEIGVKEHTHGVQIHLE